MRVLLGTADQGLSPPTLLLSPCLALSLFLVFQVRTHSLSGGSLSISQLPLIILSIKDIFSNKDPGVFSLPGSSCIHFSPPPFPNFYTIQLPQHFPTFY